MKVSSITSTQPPQVGPVTERAGPCQVHGPAGSRSPKRSRARGSAQSTPKSSDSPGSVISILSPVTSAARSDRAWTSSTPGPGPRCTWDDPP